MLSLFEGKCQYGILETGIGRRGWGAIPAKIAILIHHQYECIVKTCILAVSVYIVATISTGIIQWASTRENLFSGFATKNGADQPAHMRSLISTFVVRLLESTISNLATCSSESPIF